MQNEINKELRRKLEEALDHINAVRAVLEKPIAARDLISIRAECGSDLELAAIRIVGAITTIRTDG